MPVKNVYGKTIWGNAFVSAIGNLDENARLGRGKTYANTGRVYSIQISKNIVKVSPLAAADLLQLQIM